MNVLLRWNLKSMNVVRKQSNANTQKCDSFKAGVKGVLCELKAVVKGIFCDPLLGVKGVFYEEHECCWETEQCKHTEV